VDPQRHLYSARKTFRLLLFAGRGANRVPRLEQIPGEARPERLSCSSLEVPGLEIRLPLPGGSPRHKLCSLRLRGKSAWIGVPGKTLSHSSDCAERLMPFGGFADSPSELFVHFRHGPVAAKQFGAFESYMRSQTSISRLLRGFPLAVANRAAAQVITTAADPAVPSHSSASIALRGRNPVGSIPCSAPSRPHRTGPDRQESP
jgi:hypothetical protein